MRTINIFEKGDKVLIKGIIAEVMVDETGVHKYRVKDGKGGLTTGTWYTTEQLAQDKQEVEDEETV